MILKMDTDIRDNSTVAEHVIVTTENEKETTILWNASSDNPTSRMKVIGQGNETLGDISISQSQLMALFANKSENGIVTLHLENADGVTNPVQLQIVAEDQLFPHETFLPDDSSEITIDTAAASECDSIKAQHGEEVTPVLQLSREHIQSLVRNPSAPIKSVVFKQINDGSSRKVRRCLESDPDFKKFVKFRPYVAINKEEVMVYNTTNDKAKYKCNRCDKYFSFPGNLKRHIINLHQHKPGSDLSYHECQYCKKKYSRRDYMIQHIKSVHERITIFKCEHCEKEFTQRGSLTRHTEAVHLNVRRFDCRYCPYRAQSLNDLKKHAAAIHLNRTRYECVICGHKSWSAFNLKTHVSKSHPSTAKLIKCKYCDLLVDTAKEYYYSHIKSCKLIYNNKKSTKSKRKSSGKEKKSKNSEFQERDPVLSEAAHQSDFDYSDVPMSIPRSLEDECAIPWTDLCNMGYEDEECEISESGNFETTGETEIYAAKEDNSHQQQWA